MSIQEMISDHSNSNVLMDGSVPLGGVYANLVHVWHTGLEFTVEFAVSLPSGPDSRRMRCTSHG